MTTYNNKTKNLDADDKESYNGSSGKGMPQPVSHFVIETFYNDIKNFETYLDTSEVTL